MAPAWPLEFTSPRDRFPVSSYFESRDEFRGIVDLLGWTRSAHPISGRGPNDEELTVDVTWSEDRRDLPTFIISSGLHGVEAFFGANAQLELLHCIGLREIDLRGVRLVLIHALNPYGFAHERRFDADNIDPNRNFLLPGEAYAGSPDGYAELDALINPRTASSADCFYPRAMWKLLRLGMPKLKQAIAGGQYDFPQGLFFGGHGPCETHRLLQQHFAGWIQEAERVVHLDLHSGLGKRGTAKLLLETSLTTQQQAWLDRHLGADTYEVCDSAGLAYVARGGFGKWCVAQNFASNYLFACAEFGTYPPLKVLAGLRAENREHHWGMPGSASYLAAKQQLRKLFIPFAWPRFLSWKKIIDGLRGEL